MKKDSIGNRLKNNYEFRGVRKLIRRIPVIIRLDGNAFHTLTKKCKRPFDDRLLDIMKDTTLYLCNKIQGVKCAYCQSDEISLLLTDFDRLNTEAWFDYNISKMESISAGMSSSHFSLLWGSEAVFDSRARNYPKEEVCNYFIWRQIDWIRNSVSMLAQSLYSHKQLHKKNQSDMHEMIHEKGLNWSDLGDVYKNGLFVYKNGRSFMEDSSIIFTKNRDIIDRYLIPGEE